MNKKLFLIIGCSIIVICIVIAIIVVNNNNNSNNTTGQNQSNNSSYANSNSSTKKPDHKIYKYVKMSSDNSSTLLYSVTSLFDNPGDVSSGDVYYKPTIIAEFDTETGKATKATFYAFFLDGEDDENVNKALQKYNNSTSEYKKYFTNVHKDRVNSEISCLVADLDVNANLYTQYIDSYILDSQDIDKYKDRIYYSRLYNYSTTPPHEEGSNFFEESLEGIRIEWSDNEITVFKKSNNTSDISNTTNTVNTVNI